MTETNIIEFKAKLTDDFEKEVVAFLNYRDRLEITSAGNLPEGMDTHEFFEGVSNPRNKEIM